MTTTYPDAIDSMFALFNTEWSDGTADIVGYVPEVWYPDVEEPDAPPAGKYWARISQQTVDEPQSTLRDGSNGQRYTNSGMIFVQIFAPKSADAPMTKLRLLAQLTKNIFRGHTDSDSIWFRNSRIQELPPEEKFYNFNVVAEYQYDEIG